MTNKVYGMHHIGITVPNIEEGIAFFKAVFGAVEVFRTGPFDVDQDFMTKKIGAAPQSTIRDLVFLRCGAGTSVELFEYSGEEENPSQTAVGSRRRAHVFRGGGRSRVCRAPASARHRAAGRPQPHHRGAAEGF